MEILKKIISKKLIQPFISCFKKDCMEVLGRDYNLSVRLSNINLPDEIRGFEDLISLIASAMRAGVN